MREVFVLVKRSKMIKIKKPEEVVNVVDFNRLYKGISCLHYALVSVETDK